MDFFGCGYVAKYKNRLVCEYIVTKIDDIVNHIIPFFDKYKIIGSKHSNFLDFKSAALIIKNKEHLKQDGIGLNKILLLKNYKNYFFIKVIIFIKVKIIFFNILFLLIFLN